MTSRSFVLSPIAGLMTQEDRPIRSNVTAPVIELGLCRNVAFRHFGDDKRVAIRVDSGRFRWAAGYVATRMPSRRTDAIASFDRRQTCRALSPHG